MNRQGLLLLLVLGFSVGGFIAATGRYGAETLPPASASLGPGPVSRLEPKEDRSAAQVVAEFDRLRAPASSMRMDAADFDRRLSAMSTGKCELALELLALDPDHAELPRLMQARWALISNYFGDHEQLRSETTEWIDCDDPELARSARFFHVRSGIQLEEVPTDDVRAGTFGFVGKYSGDKEACANLLSTFLERRTSDAEEQLAICELVRDRWPKAISANAVHGHASVLRRVGQELSLELPTLDGGQYQLNKAPAEVLWVHLWDPNRPEEDEAVKNLVSWIAKTPSAAQVVSVVERGLGKDIEHVRSRTEELGMDWPVLLDQESLTEGFGWRLGITRAEAWLRVDPERRLSAVAYRWELLK